MKLWIPICLLLVQSCATTVVKQFSSSVPPCDISGKTITVRTSKVVHYQEQDFATIYRNKDSEEGVKEYFSKFKSLKVEFSFPKIDEQVFKGPSYEKRLKEVFESEIHNSKTDYFLDLVTEIHVRDPGHGTVFLMLVTGAAHVISLGLIPIYDQQSPSQYAYLYNSNGELLKKIKASTVSSTLQWSPFYFRKDSRKRNDPSIGRDTYEVLTSKLIHKTFCQN